jgi:hypothetical protein
MKYGEPVIYVRNGQELNALAVAHFDNDELSLIYLDPIYDRGKRSVASTATAFAKPLAKGGKNGWKRHSAPASLSDLDATEATGKESSGGSLTTQETRDKLAQSFVSENKLVIPDGANLGDVLQFLEDLIVANGAKKLLGAPEEPSGADLDAHAAEQDAKQATAANQPPAQSGPVCETCKDCVERTNSPDVPAGWIHTTEPEDHHAPVVINHAPTDESSKNEKP